jgi:hypothetical protein
VVGETVDLELGPVVVGWGRVVDPDELPPPEQPASTRAAATRMTSAGGPTRGPAAGIFMDERYP